jgi:hypothetical protein
MVNTHLVSPAGNYIVQYSFIGYESISSVTIKNGITITLSKALERQPTR